MDVHVFWVSNIPCLTTEKTAISCLFPAVHSCLLGGCLVEIDAVFILPSFLFVLATQSESSVLNDLCIICVFMPVPCSQSGASY